MNYKKLFTILVWAFVLFEIGNIFVLLDMLNVFDFGMIIGNDIEEILIPISQTALFIFGEIVALVMLLKTGTDIGYIKRVKIISLLFLVISPGLFPLFPLIYSILSIGLPGTMDNVKELSDFIIYGAIPLILAIIVFVVYFTQLYSLSLLWSKTRKILFGIISSVVHIIVGIFILVFTFFGLIDRGLS